MGTMHRLRLWHKMALGLCAMLSLVAISGLMATREMNSIKQWMLSVKEIYMPLAANAVKAELYIKEIPTFMNLYLFTRKEQYWEKAKDALVDSQVKLNAVTGIDNSAHALPEVISHTANSNIGVFSGALLETHTVQQDFWKQQQSMIATAEVLQGTLNNFRDELLEKFLEIQNQDRETASTPHAHRLLFAEETLRMITLLRINMLRSLVLHDQSEMRQKVSDLFSRYFTSLDRLETQAVSQHEKSLVGFLREEGRIFQEKQYATLALWDRVNELTQRRNETRAATLESVAAISQKANTLHAAAVNDTIQAVEAGSSRIFLSSLLIFVLGLAFGIILTRSITVPVEAIQRFASLVAGGRRTQRLHLQRTDELGELAAALDHMVDTLQEQAEQLVEREKALNFALLDNIPDAIVIKSPDGKFLDVNKAFATLFEMPREALIGSDDEHLLASQDDALETLQHSWRTVLETGQQQYVEVLFTSKLGPKYMDIVLAPCFDDEGKIVMALGIGRDVTERKRMEVELVAAKEAAEAANLAKRDFLANMSHEIRTPMNGVLGLTHLALQAQPPQPLRDYLYKIEDSARSLLRIINGILDFSKIEAGSMELEEVPFEVRRTLQSVFDMFAVNNTKNLALDFQVAPEIPVFLRGDPLRFSQVLINLLSNAIKFTPAGSITLRLSLEHADDENVIVGGMVRDTGVGVPPNRLDTLFTPFAQADASVTRKFGGTGLGLSIVQGIVQRMHGDIQVHSVHGQGTTFTFTMRFLQDDGSAEPLPSDTRNVYAQPGMLRGARILIVEDNEINRLIARELLEYLGCEVVEAIDGAEGVRCVVEAAPPFHAVLMDIQMPVMDGISAARELRTKPQCARLPIIAMTAHAMADDRERSLEAGMDDHVTKPIEPQRLVAVLCKLLGFAENAETTISQVSLLEGEPA